MAAKRCPACALVNPGTATRCDCGWSFVTSSVESRGDEQPSVEDLQVARRARADRMIIIGTVSLVIGALITAATYSSASQSGGTYIIAYGAIITGIVEIVTGLAMRNR